MNHDIQMRLRQIIEQHGRDLVRQPRLFDTYLADLLPNHPHIRRYLVKALQSGVVNQMLPEPDPSRFPALSEQLARVTALGLNEAKEIVAYWGYALASDPDVLIKNRQLVPKAQANGSLKQTLLMSIVGALGLLGVAWFASNHFNAAPSLPSLPTETVDLMNGGKPMFVETVKIAQPPVELQPETVSTSTLVQPQVQDGLVGSLETILPAVKTAKASGSTVVAPTDLSPTQLQSLNQVQRLSREAMNALQRFREQSERMKQKLAAQQSLTAMWDSSQAPYYRQQQFVINNHIKVLDQQLNASLQHYNSALSSLSALVQDDEVLINMLDGSELQQLIKQQVAQGKTSVSREQLSEALSMVM